MNIRQYVGPDGMVEVAMPDGTSIKRWPIDAKQMIAEGGGKPVALRPSATAPAPAPEPEPAPKKLTGFPSLKPAATKDGN